ncbi:hypothetical protein N9772_06675 [Bacteroidia bacterium]|nr:hypothetical protein [Bacteroidia bacterium]
MAFSAHGHEDTKMLNIIQMWINNVAGHSNMKLTIDAVTGYEGAKQ